MLRIILSTLFVFALNYLSAQLYVKGNLDVKNAASIYVDGGIEGIGLGQITNEGNINLISGDWKNNASNTFLDGTGDLSFLSGSIQTIEGGFTTSFYNLIINNSGDGIRLYSNISVANNLQMTDGDFDLKSSVVDLSTTGNLIGETSSNRIKSTDGLGIPGNGTGTIEATRDNPSGNVAGLGLSVNLIGNNINIKRGHLVQSGTGGYSSNSSVFRYYEVSPVANAGGGNSITFNDCYSQELNGHNPSELIMYQWWETNNSGIEQWNPLPDNASGSSVPITQTLDVGSLNYIKVTLGSESAPLPVELIHFSADCIRDAVEVSWQTATENNNNYFLLQASDDGIYYENIEKIIGSGNSNQIINYNTLDQNIQKRNELIYYRLKQVNFDGSFSLSDVISVKNCNYIPENIDIKLYPNPAKDKFRILTSSKGRFDLQIDITDLLGKKVFEQNFSIDSESIGNIIDINEFPTGVYLVRITDNKLKTSVLQQKLVVQK